MSWLTFGTILITAIITNIVAYFFQWLRHESIQDQKYSNTLQLLKDETLIIDDKLPVFNPDLLHLLNPVNILAPDILISDFFHRINKDPQFLKRVSNLRVSVNNHNHFLGIYNEIILKNPKDVDLKEARYKNAVHYYALVVGDKMKLLQYLHQNLPAV